MARRALFIVPDIPHHVTQRGNRRQEVFVGGEDYAAYRRRAGWVGARVERGLKPN